MHDAKLLLEQKRYDNSVYLAGYVVECSLKSLVQVYVSAADAQAFSHDLQALQEDGLALIRTLFPEVDSKLPNSRTGGTVLGVDHPQRRYGPNNRWTDVEATLAVMRAEEIFQEVIAGLILDGRLREEDV
jgi:HEPN domain-containing protein